MVHSVRCTNGLLVQCVTSEGDGAALAPGQELVQPPVEGHELLHQGELVVRAPHHHLKRG